jgi:hypothetical protein
MGPQCLEGPEHRTEVSGSESLDPPGLVGDAGDLIQIPTHRAQRTDGVPQLGEFAIGSSGTFCR